MEDREHPLKLWIVACFLLCGSLSFCFNHIVIPSNNHFIITSSNYLEYTKVPTDIYASNQNNEEDYYDNDTSNDHHPQSFTSFSCALLSEFSSVLERSKKKKIRLKHGKPFALKVYQDTDKALQSIRRRRWITHKVEAFNVFFSDYSELHKIPLSDITFIDIGANIAWFTMNLAALGVHVIAFESQSTKKSIDVIKGSMCLSENLDSGVSNHITLYDHDGLGMVGDETEKCVVYSNNANAGDGQIKCPKEGSEELAIPSTHSIKGYFPQRRFEDALNNGGKIMVIERTNTEGYESIEKDGGTIFFLEEGVYVIVKELVLDNPDKFKKKFSESYLAETESVLLMNAPSHADKTSSRTLSNTPLYQETFTRADSIEAEYMKRGPILKVPERAIKSQEVTYREKRRRMNEWTASSSI